MSRSRPPRTDIKGARVLAVLGDSRHDRPHLPRRQHRQGSPGGKYLSSTASSRGDFNSYGARRGNHEVMVRGTFANIRLRNGSRPAQRAAGRRTSRRRGDVDLRRVGEVPGRGRPADRHRRQGVRLRLIARLGGEGHAAARRPRRDRRSYERIHRSNLVGMGILPLQFDAGASGRACRSPAKRPSTSAVSPTVSRRASASPCAPRRPPASLRPSKSSPGSTPSSSSNIIGTAASCSTCCGASSRRRAPPSRRFFEASAAVDAMDARRWRASPTLRLCCSERRRRCSRLASCLARVFVDRLCRALRGRERGLASRPDAPRRDHGSSPTIATPSAARRTRSRAASTAPFTRTARRTLPSPTTRRC